MFSQHFGQYLLNKGLLTKDQLHEVLSYECSANPKIGVLAIDAGYMTAAQVEKVHFLQHSLDRKFGEIAIEKGFLTSGQLDVLLKNQKSKRVSLSQIIVEKKFMNLSQLEMALEKYKTDNKLTVNDYNALLNQDYERILKTYLDFSSAGPYKDMLYDYAALTFRCFQRILGEAPTLGSVFSGTRLVVQSMTENITITTGLSMNDETLIKLAQKYSGEEITGVNDLALDCAAEFLNEINGLFTVNMSENDLELDLKPPQIRDNPELFQESFRFCIDTSCGPVSLQLKVSEQH